MKSSDPLSTRRSDNGYLELGEVSDLERKVEGGAYGCDLDGRRPPAIRKDLGITRTTDVEVVFGGRERDGD